MSSKELSTEELANISGGKIIRLTQWQLYDTKKKKPIPDYNAIAHTTGQTIVNGWVSSVGTGVGGGYK